MLMKMKITTGEIATRLSHLYGPVCFLEILLHPATLYPMGAARGTFIQESAFIAAMKSKFLELPEGGIMKRVSFQLNQSENERLIMLSL